MGLLLSLCFICLALPAAFSQLTTVTIHLEPTSTLTEVVWALVTPLTTVFTPPCGAVIMAAQMETPECVAPGMSSVWRNGGFYSPGVCPSGYTTNCVRSEKRDGELIPIRPGETAAMCVPQGWTCYGGVPTNLAFYITSHGVYTAPAIEIRWRKRDLDSLYSATLTATSSPPNHDVSTRATPSTSVSMTLATVSSVQSIPTNDTRPPESSTTPTTDEDPGEHNFNNSELSGIIFGDLRGNHGA
ncbi:drug transporter [Ceratocystis lukuohia]|uniref:Drug transporter n=1 Tax=Ceratocystis lukuohia TaxID=2019550 RepID=A0ABR4MKS0_9PEZI